MSLIYHNSDTYEGLLKAWLNPNGKFIIGYDGRYAFQAFHEQLAGVILLKILKLDYDQLDKWKEENNLYYSYDTTILEEKFRYIRLHNMSGDIKDSRFIGNGYSPKKAQINTMLFWASDNGFEPNLSKLYAK